MIASSDRAIVIAMRCYAALALVLVTVSTASADRPRTAARTRPAEQPAVRANTPPPVAKPPPVSMTLRSGVFAASLVTEMSVTAGAVAEPSSFAPDLSFGATDRLTIALIHSGSAMTGFRGSAGWGLCFSGPERACRSPYTAGGIDALVGITEGSVALALEAGLLWSTVDPTVHNDIKLGFKLRLSEGNVFALLTPSVWLALDDRYDRVVPHEHQLWVPVSLWVKPVAPLAVGIGTGVKGPLVDFADRMSIPLGAAVQYTWNKNIAIGTSFVFGKLLGGGAVMDPGMDSRVVQLWINLQT
jgi:hypothetical protein